MKIKEVRKFETNDLVEKIKESEFALDKMKLSHKVTPLADPSQIKKARRDIARMKTELRAISERT